MIFEQQPSFLKGLIVSDATGVSFPRVVPV